MKRQALLRTAEHRVRDRPAFLGNVLEALELHEALPRASVRRLELLPVAVPVVLHEGQRSLDDLAGRAVVLS